jgi:hypothetical protein
MATIARRPVSDGLSRRLLQVPECVTDVRHMFSEPVPILHYMTTTLLDTHTTCQMQLLQSWPDSRYQQMEAMLSVSWLCSWVVWHENLGPTTGV